MKRFFKLIGRQVSPSAPLVLHNPEQPSSDWPGFGEEEGQLSVDIYQTEDAVIVKSTIAGATTDDIDISLVEDMLTIRGKREQPEAVANDAYLYRECYWGKFSRSIVLPVEIKSDKVIASIHNGVLTITLPKAHRSKTTTIRVKQNKD